MDENVKNNQISDDELENVSGGNAPTMSVHSMGSRQPISTSQSKLINKAMEQSQNNSPFSAGDNIQPAAGRIRDTEISGVMTETEMKQAGKRAPRF